MVNLPRANRFIEADKKVRRPEITIILGNLVFED